MVYFIKEPPPESLWLIFDCSKMTIKEIIEIIGILRIVSDNEKEVIEALRSLCFSELTIKQMNCVYKYVKWSRRNIYLLKELVREYNKQ